MLQRVLSALLLLLVLLLLLLLSPSLFGRNEPTAARRSRRLYTYTVRECKTMYLVGGGTRGAGVADRSTVSEHRVAAALGTRAVCFPPVKIFRQS